MNVEIGTEAAQFPEKEYKNGIFLAVCQQTEKEQISGFCYPFLCMAKGIAFFEVEFTKPLKFSFFSQEMKENVVLKYH
jgi:hypothetical protein